MSDTRLAKEEWNKLVADIEEFVKAAAEKSSYRLFFHGIEVHDIFAEPATRDDEIELIGIWIYALGPTSKAPHFNRKLGITVHSIAYFHRWEMTVSEIRERLKHLEMRQVNVVAQFPNH